MKTLLLASVLFAGLFGFIATVPVLPAPAPAPAPYHAFCKTVWIFVLSCDDIRINIVEQLQEFNIKVACDICQYEISSVSPQFIKANHTSIDGRQTENLTFTLNPMMSGGCHVSAQSSSLGFSSLLDYGLNYCNLYYILSVRELNAVPGFLEIINEWNCPGYGLHTCLAPGAQLN